MKLKEVKERVECDCSACDLLSQQRKASNFYKTNFDLELVSFFFSLCLSGQWKQPRTPHYSSQKLGQLYRTFSWEKSVWSACSITDEMPVCIPDNAKPQSMAYIGTGKQVELLKIFSEKCAVLKKPQCITKRHSCWKEQSCHGCCEGHLAELAGGAGEPAPRSTALLWEQRRCSLGAHSQQTRGGGQAGGQRPAPWGSWGHLGMHGGTGKKQWLGKRAQESMVKCAKMSNLSFQKWMIQLLFSEDQQFKTGLTKKKQNKEGCNKLLLILLSFEVKHCCHFRSDKMRFVVSHKKGKKK